MAQVKTRLNQRSVYLDEDTAQQVQAFMHRYPYLSFSMINNAALRLYFHETAGGIDGNLEPLHSP
jgi:hypothetical protein